jgi:8-oxo-dGTP pyrophosphatase MutT (NUDIX family)
MTRTKTRRETSAGGVIFRCAGDGAAAGARYLLIYDGHGNWGFPKGHLEHGEEPAAAARREIAEETGLDGIVLHDALGTIDWFFRFRGRLIHKYCHFFLFESPAGVPVPQAEEGIQRCEWHDAAAALETVTHENARGVLREAIGRVRALCRPGTPAPRA